MGQVPFMLGAFASGVHGWSPLSTWSPQCSLPRMHQVPLSRQELLRLHGHVPLASLEPVARACDRLS